MKFLGQEDHFIRLAMKHCKSMVLFLQMISTSEQQLKRSLNGFVEIEVLFGRITSGETLSEEVRLTVKIDGNAFFRKALKLEKIEMDFMYADKVDWIKAVDNMFTEAITDFFTTGLFNMCRFQMNKDGVMEEKDVETL